MFKDVTAPGMVTVYYFMTFFRLNDALLLISDENDFSCGLKNVVKSSVDWQKVDFSSEYFTKKVQNTDE